MSNSVVMVLELIWLYSILGNIGIVLGLISSLLLALDSSYSDRSISSVLIG